jgi:cytochrome P450/NADPH-cytochrome P450 reductase
LYVAFSRGPGQKTYVQDLIGAQKDRVWSLIEGGAIIFVCGDGSRMEPDVKRKLMDIYREKAQVDEAAAERWIDDMGTQNRYVLDVWAGN